jgi:hypothetical protein
LVGVGEAKSSGSCTPGISEVREIFTLGDVDGDFIALSAMFFILSAFVLGALLDTKFLHGGVEKLGETFGVEAVVADPNSFCHLWVLEESVMVVCGWMAEGAAALLLLKVGKSWRWDSLVGMDDDEGEGVPSLIRCRG